MFRILRVTGSSLLPEYHEGDYVVITTIPFFRSHVRAGDVVVFRHVRYGTMIKMVSQVMPHKTYIFVTGTHPHSVDSRTLGPIPKQDVIGKVLWHIKKTNEPKRTAEL